MIIKIKNLSLKTHIGVYDWEKEQKRQLLFNVEIKTRSTKAMKSDNIEDAVDYDWAVNVIKDYVANNNCQLLEKMVGDILDLIMENDAIDSCTLEIDKLKVYNFVESFSVTQSKNRKNDITNR